jgi:hypothetical protein
MSKEYIISPKSGKWIKIEGDTYADLLKNPRYAENARSSKRILRSSSKSKTKISKTKSKSLPKILHQESLKKTLATLPASRKAKKRDLQRMITHKGEKRGRSTRGWAAISPSKGIERHELKQKCGDKCFLMPSKEKFPICPSLRSGQGCKVDCRGVTAAKMRAKEWKYTQIVKMADELEKKYGCLSK